MPPNSDLSAVVAYMKSHWPSPVKSEWQVALDAYPALVQQAVADLSQNTTKHHRLIRVAGISGSGKTTQILPAVDAYAKTHHLRPALLAARQFVSYHPHYQAILDHYGPENLRKMTDEFSTIMLFMTLATMIQAGYDIVLDVTLLDPKMEAILLKLLHASQYHLLILIIAISPHITEQFLAERAWRHSPQTEAEFIRATEKALSFYSQTAPDTRIIIWSVYHQPPEYDGPINGCLPIFQQFTQDTSAPAADDAERRQAKIDYLSQLNFV